MSVRSESEHPHASGNAVQIYLQAVLLNEPVGFLAAAALCILGLGSFLLPFLIKLFALATAWNGLVAVIGIVSVTLSLIGIFRSHLDFRLHGENVPQPLVWGIIANVVAAASYLLVTWLR